MHRDKGKLLMIFFIFSETFFFIALIIAYVYYRNFSDATDTVAKHLDAFRAGIFTLFLIASSFTLLFSKKALLKKKYTNFKLWMALTILFGVIFMLGQVTEYIGLYQKQITLKKDIFGSSFFTLTGFHGLHVSGGVIYLLYVAKGVINGRYEEKGYDIVEICGLYWHFVDLVWVFIFAFFYLW
jgi:heme/copper-type cytochrome/quinol oxidase subunit 3